MAYATGTVSGATPTTDLQAALKTAVTGAGWTFVETVTSGAYVADVYLSPAAGNSVGTDFYVSVLRSATGGGYMALRVHEAYDLANHNMSIYAPSGGYTLTPTMAPGYKNPQADTAPTQGFNAAQCPVGAAASTTTYLFSITHDRIILATRSGTNDYGMYGGLYTSIIPGDVLPLVTLDLVNTSTSSTYGSCPREPGQAASSQYNFYVALQGGASDALGAYTTSQDLYASAKWATKVMLRSLRGGIRGVLKDIMWTANGGATDLLDTCTIDGTAYTVLGTYLAVNPAV